MSVEKFEFSGHPKRVEYYPCYDDTAREYLIDGSEILRNHNWNERQKAKWHFFYRPIPALVGKPQADAISRKRAEISSKEDSIDDATSKIGSLHKRLIEMESTIKMVLGGCGIGAILSVFLFWDIVALLPVGFAVHYVVEFIKERKNNHRQIQESKAIIGKLKSEVENIKKQIQSLQSEIDALLSQIPKIESPETIEKWLAEDIRDMEYKCLGEILSTEVNADNISDYIRHKPVDERVHSLLIDSWGFLQPASIRGPYGDEGTGLNNVQKNLKESIATLRIGSKGQPLPRVLYLQYIFLLKRNINVYSFFFDFISQNWYGRRCETFQYNHVTNFSIREVEIEAEKWANDLAFGRGFIDGLFGQEINMFLLAVANGAHFRCVLFDEAVTDGLNQWLQTQEKIKSIKLDIPSRKELMKQFKDDKKAVDKWISQEKEAQEDLKKIFLKQKMKIEQQDIGKARAALRQIREDVETYEQRVASAG